MLDFTGELNRYAVARATARDKAAVAACRDVVEGVMGQFLQLDLRNSALRKKYDALKYTLRKMVRCGEAGCGGGVAGGAARPPHARSLLRCECGAAAAEPDLQTRTTHTHTRVQENTLYELSLTDAAGGLRPGGGGGDEPPPGEEEEGGKA